MNFNFPFAVPYGIQVQLMTHIYETLSASQVTVVESPTGTVSRASATFRSSSAHPRPQGKSLSIICASLTFLASATALSRAELVASIRAQVAQSAGDEPDWVVEQEIERQLNERDKVERELDERLERIRRRERADGDGRRTKRAVSRSSALLLGQ